MLWIKALHIIFMVTWFAGLLYLPRLYVYHSQCEDEPGHLRFCIMENKLFIIMTIGASLTVFFGCYLWLAYGISGSWLNLKLVLVSLLLIYHAWCKILNQNFKNRRNRHSALFYRCFNEIPALLLIGIIILVVVKPF